MTQNYTVMAIVEAKPGKEAELRHVLTESLALSHPADACIEYHLHQDNSNPALFFLYEKWQSKELHQQQFQKPYIRSLIQKLNGLLTKPSQGFFADSEIQAQCEPTALS